MSYPVLNIMEFLVKTKQFISLLFPSVSFLGRVPLLVDSVTWFVNIDSSVCSLFKGQKDLGTEFNREIPLYLYSSQDACCYRENSY